MKKRNSTIREAKTTLAADLSLYFRIGSCKGISSLLVLVLPGLVVALALVLLFVVSRPPLDHTDLVRMVSV